MPRTGGNSQDRRRTRRAAERRVSKGTSASVLDFDELVAAASGSTTLPLSDQGRAWDASAADKRVRDWAGADDAPNAKYGTAFFVKQGDGSNFGDYKLGFADVLDGTLTAVWRGVTAVAAVLQGSRGGVQGLSDAERASVKAKVAAYYSKAAKQYDDDGIKVPWDAEESAGETAAFLLAYADFGSVASDLELCDVIVSYAEQLGETETVERLAGVDSEEAATAALETFGGKPSRGTAADRRLKENEEAALPEVEALALIDSVIRPGGFAIGDVQWTEEEGFVDLLCDINDLLRQGSNPYGYRAVDVSVKLDKARICDYDGDSEYIAPISIGTDGEPVLSPMDDWIPVGDALIEVAPDEDEEDEPESEAQADGGEMSRAAGTFANDADRVRFELRDIVLLADGATEVELPEAHKPGETIPRRNPSPRGPKPMPTGGDEAVAAGNEIAWRAIFVPEGALTDDGRAFAPGSLTWRELPLSLMAMTETSAQGGHDGAVLAGRIDRIWREGDLILAEGVFDAGEFGQGIARMVGDRTLRGLSVDTAIHEYEVGPRSDYFNEDGSWRTDRPAATGDEPTLEEMLFGEPDPDEPRVFVVTNAVIGMATVCPFPAFAEASISLVASGGGAVWRYTSQSAMQVVARPKAEEPAKATLTLVPKEVVVEVAETGERMTLSLEGDLDETQRQAAYEALLEQGMSEAEARGTIWPDEAAAELTASGAEEEESLTASAAGHAPLKPPVEWFQNPELEEVTPLTVTEDGRIFGHAWTWDICHISFPDSCVLAPHSQTENAYFHLGEIECEDGTRLSVGKITLDAPHAGARLSRADATAHYDHTGTVVAHVVSGEDEFGGWFSGAIVPDLPESKLRLLSGSALSGDWRNVNGNLELVALLAVNVPGFPVPRPRALVAAGADGAEEVLALTAAGIVLEAKTPCETVAEIAALAAEVDPPQPTDDDLAAFSALVELAEG